MDEAQIKNIIEAALLAAGRPLSLDKLLEIFKAKGNELERTVVRSGINALMADYESRGLEVKEVASGYRVQVRSSIRDWLDPLFEERAPRYTRALLETLALIAYRQPITRAEIEEVRGVTVSPNIVRTLMERGWIRVVGYRDVPGKPSMLGTTREFLDYFGLKRLDDLPPLADIKEGLPELSPQSDFLEALEEAERARAGHAMVEEQPTLAAEDEPSTDAATHGYTHGDSYQAAGDVAVERATPEIADQSSVETDDAEQSAAGTGDADGEGDTRRGSTAPAEAPSTDGAEEEEPAETVSLRLVSDQGSS